MAIWKFIPVVVPLYGGLGNQLFICATGFAYAQREQRPLLILDFWYQGLQRPNRKLDMFRREPEIFKFLEDIPIIKTPKLIQFFLYYLIRFLARLRTNNNFVFTETSSIAPRAMTSSKLIFLNGLFQNPAYFNDIREELVRVFVHKGPPNETEKIMCHIRIGDNFLKVNDFSGVLTPDYFEGALEIIDPKRDCETLYFSDLNEIAKRDYQVPSKALDNSDSLYKTFAAMMACDHFIIGNSTLSWWAAYLGRSASSRIVIPAPFYKKKIDNISIHNNYLPGCLTFPATFRDDAK